MSLASSALGGGFFTTAPPRKLQDDYKLGYKLLKFFLNRMEEKNREVSTLDTAAAKQIIAPNFRNKRHLTQISEGRKRDSHEKSLEGHEKKILSIKGVFNVAEHEINPDYSPIKDILKMSKDEPCLTLTHTWFNSSFNSI